MGREPRSHGLGGRASALTKALVRLSKDHFEFAFREAFEQLSFVSILLRESRLCTRTDVGSKAFPGPARRACADCSRALPELRGARLEGGGDDPRAGGDAARRGWALVPARAPGWMLAALTPDCGHGPESESRTGPPAAGPRPQRSVCVMEIRQPCKSGIPLPASRLVSASHKAQGSIVTTESRNRPLPRADTVHAVCGYFYPQGAHLSQNGQVDKMVGWLPVLARL